MAIREWWQAKGKEASAGTGVGPAVGSTAHLLCTCALPPHPKQTRATHQPMPSTAQSHATARPPVPRCAARP